MATAPDVLGSIACSHNSMQNSSAQDVGLEPGDVIRQIENIQISNLNDFRDALIKLPLEAHAVFLIQRGSRGYYVTLKR